MKRLCELVDVAVNNEACVVFKPKKDTRMDLISLGCFRGDEEMIRMTKGRTPEITVFYQDGKSFSYHFGEGSTTVISDNMQKQREMIRECAILDFGIVCDLSHVNLPYSDEHLIGTTLDVKGLSDADRMISLVSGGGVKGHIKVNSQIVARDVNVKDVSGWFEKRGYHVEFEQDISKGLSCGKVFGECVPLKEYQISQMPHELSEDRLVRFVQQELLCDKGRAAEFLEGFGKARMMQLAEHVVRNTEATLAEFGEDFRIDTQGFRQGIRNLTDEDWLELGRRLEDGYKLVLTDAEIVESDIDLVVDWMKKHQGKNVDRVISDANQRSVSSHGDIPQDKGERISSRIKD